MAKKILFFLVSVSILIGFSGCATQTIRTGDFQNPIAVLPLTIKAITPLKTIYGTYKTEEKCDKVKIYEEYFGKVINGVTINAVYDIYVDDIVVDTFSYNNTGKKASRNSNNKYKHICTIMANGVEYDLNSLKE